MVSRGPTKDVPTYPSFRHWFSLPLRERVRVRGNTNWHPHLNPLPSRERKFSNVTASGKWKRGFSFV